MLKISISKQPQQLNLPNISPLTEGRHIGIIIQVADLGDQPAFDAGNPPEQSYGVVIQIEGIQVAKKVRHNLYPKSHLMTLINGAVPDDYEGDEPLTVILGRPVAIEIQIKKGQPDIISFHRPERFELDDVSPVTEADLVFFDNVELLEGAAGEAIYHKLHQKLRTWISDRVRG